nr:DUF1284 domain-containing protein [Bacillus sp. T3]
MSLMFLRGHHLLCIQGFRGMGYSEDFVKNMTEIVAEIQDRDNDFPIRVVAGFDNACMSCPNRGDRICEANEGSQKHVITMDLNVIQHLGLIVGKYYQKSTLMDLVAKRVDPDDLDELCKGCSWLQYGVCKQGIIEMKDRFGVIENQPIMAKKR